MQDISIKPGQPQELQAVPLNSNRAETNEVAFERTDALILQKCSHRFQILCTYSSPFVKKPDSLNRPKKLLLLNLRLQVLLLIAGELKNPQLTSYTEFLNILVDAFTITELYWLWLLYGAIAAIVSGIIVYFFNFFVTMIS